jgi:hypothetical protein
MWVTSSTHPPNPLNTESLTTHFNITQPIGVTGAPASRLVPKHHFVDTASQDSLRDAILSGTSSAHFKQILISCPVNYPVDSAAQENETSVPEAWRTCLWNVVAGTFWTYGAGVESVKAAYKKSSEAIRPLRDLTPEGAVYSVSRIYDEQRWTWRAD